MRYGKLLFAAAMLCGLSLSATAVEITISCGAVGQEGALCEEAARAWATETGHSVRFDIPPDNTDQRYFQYLIGLGDGDAAIDVYQIDVIWPGLLAKHLVDLREHLGEDDIAPHHPTIIANNTVAGRLVGMPWYTDVGMLYYRKDLLEKYQLPVPATWAELTDVALHIQEMERATGNAEIVGFVFLGAAYEGLTCNALEWIHSHGGGTVVDESGNINVDNPRAALALARAVNWMGTITPRRVTAFNEEDARTTFQLGNAVFMRNWPYAWSLLNAPESLVAGKVGVAPLPRGGATGESAATLGGWQLAVAKTSAHPEVAADLVRYLSSAAVQKQRAISGSYAPTIMSLYEDAEVLEANPFFAELRPILERAVARPSASTGQDYMAVSGHIWDAVHRTLLGAGSPADNLRALQDRLRLIKARGDW